MSRVGNAPIPIPSGVTVDVKGSHVTVKGPKGTLERDVAAQIAVAVEDDQVVVTRQNETRESRALHGLTRALVSNMVTGVSAGFSKELQAVGVGYRASMKGKQLELLVGYSHPVLMDPLDGVTIEVPEPTKIVVSGIDKQQVGQMAADIRRVRPPEPYKGKGIRYADEQIRRKAGKAGVAAR